ncbi:YraN family protein [Pontibacter sp. JAM-7]|uniref:YraN family protein n=1 Tax=Pontibacter sp. JAM-7 TaxID=3366581 RepID=UPI003AF40C41
MDRKQRGKDAEKIAEKLLARHGCRLRSRNYHCRFGEIDLIMLQGDILLFVEVRYRSSQTFGGAAASVSRQKQQKIIRTAMHYLSQQPQGHTPTCRFDVIAFEASEAGLHPVWYKDAFQA